MPSFKRREPASTHRKLASGLKPAPYPSLVPLFSTGLASLDDVLSGSGLPSSSMLAICPALGLASLTSVEDEGDEQSRRKLSKTASGSDQTLEALKAAEEVALDLLSFSIAQGLVSNQETIVAGSMCRKVLLDKVPDRATSRDYGQSNVKADEDAMTIAFRYAHRPKFKTTVEEPEAAVEKTAAKETPEEHLFRAPFDMSKRLSVEMIAAAERRAKGKLRCIESSNYKEIWCAIEQEANRCRQLLKTNPGSPPALRIHLPSLGAVDKDESEGRESRLVRLSQFLVRLRDLLKDLSLQEQDPIHSICILTLSSDLLLPTASPASTNMTTLLVSRFVDAQILVSDFTNYPHLQKAYLGYGGAVSLLKGPSIGFLLPPGESRSVLRGGVAEAGAENDVGWKRRKRGIVLETLHEDVDAGVKKDTEVPPVSKKQSQGDDIEEVAVNLTRKETHTHSHSPPPAKPVRVKFEGLKSLRERGLRTTKQVNVQVEKTEEW